MKCPKCDGTGKAEIGVGAFTIHGADCDQCNGKGVIEPMTNEEYLRSCTTEQLAEELLMATMSDVLYTKIIPCKTHEDAIRVVREWLKQQRSDTE